ncbi:MAG: hypothetical protein M0Z55_05860, partial [Peptococcaceae bacterium]|nr:hypothetical protein [Peptococcaceae bacterium]
MKALLCHSCTDYNYVRAVTAEVGRQFCVAWPFVNPEEIKPILLNGSDEQGLVVLFVSMGWLEPHMEWLKIDEAAVAAQLPDLSKVLVFLLDKSSDVTQLPEVLRRCRIVRALSPKFVAREIRYWLNQILGQGELPEYVGRTKELKQAKTTLTLGDGVDTPSVFGLYGLEGIGRKTFLRSLAQETLNLPKQVVIKLDSQDMLKDIAHKVIKLTEPYTSNEELKQIFASIDNLPDSELIKRILTNMRRMTATGELPIFLDRGGLLDSTGQIAQAVRTIISNVNSGDDVYLCLITNRLPVQERSYGAKSIPFIRLDPLNIDEVKYLIVCVAKANNVELTSAQVAEVAEYLGGFA